MSLSGYEFYTKDPYLQKIMDRLVKDFYAEVPPRVAKEISRHKVIRNNRSNIRIAEDTRARISIIRIKEPLKITKIGDKYFFFSP